MTLAECIGFVDGIEHNAYTNEQKARWVSECEGKVHTEVFLRRPEDFSPLTYEGNAEGLHRVLYQGIRHPLERCILHRALSGADLGRGCL